RSAEWPETFPNVYVYVRTLWGINLIMLVFNLLPIYPLDGGQIFRSLLWFVVGRANSLMVASGLGFVGVAGMALFAYFSRQDWFWILAAFAGFNCWTGYKQAQQLLRL